MSTARIEELRKKFDENPRRYFAPLANEYRKAGDFDQAIFICQEYLPQQPGHMSGHIVFGQALFEAKRLPEAKTVFETALSLDPENLIALRHLADISRDLGDVPAARAWYDRVLQADPRNEEIAAIVAQLGSAPSAPPAPVNVAAAAATTAEAPATPPPGVSRTLPDAAAAAPTVELSADAVQELLRARQATKTPPKPESQPEKLNLDTTPTVEIRVGETAAGTMEGLEPTAHAGPMDLPAFEPLGLETNAAPGMHADAPVAAPLDGLDTIPIDISGLGAPASAPTPPPPAPSVAAPPVADDGLLDLSSFSVGGEGASAPAAAAPSPAETPIDGGHESTDLIDLDFPAPEPSTPSERPPAPSSVPTMIIDAVQSVVPAVQDAVESAAPALLDFVETAVPSVVEAVKSTVEAVAETPTAIMQAIKPPSKEEPPKEPASTSRPSQQVPFVTETMAQLYLSQGHRAEAIDIYRKLIDARPSDAELKSRLKAIEDEVAAAQPVSAPAAAPAPVPSAQRKFAGSGPSIRAVLRDLFGLDGAASFATSAPSAGGAPTEVGSIDLLFAAEPVAGPLGPLAVAFDGGYVASQGTIDDLFSGAAK